MEDLYFVFFFMSPVLDFCGLLWASVRLLETGLFYERSRVQSYRVGSFIFIVGHLFQVGFVC